MAFNRFYVISPLALVAVSACRSPYLAESPVNGAVVKGPLNNALVFLDYDDDGIFFRAQNHYFQKRIAVEMCVINLIPTL